MEFNLKEYKNQKIKQYLKKNNFIFFTINANQNSQGWLISEQELKKLKFQYYKICNKTTKKIIKESTNSQVSNMVDSTFFFLKPNNDIQINSKTLQLLNLIFFTIVAIKLNKNIYSINQVKKITTFNQKKNISILYQFLSTQIKLINFKTQRK